jgi:hypothetical protein
MTTRKRPTSAGFASIDTLVEKTTEEVEVETVAEKVDKIEEKEETVIEFKPLEEKPAKQPPSIPYTKDPTPPLKPAVIKDNKKNPRFSAFN